MDFFSLWRPTATIAGGPVRIAGYAHPLAFEFENVREFYLTPPMLRCKHAPAPIGNQIIHVVSEIPLDVGFDPVFVTGNIQPTLRLEGLTQIRYQMRATLVEPALIPDVQD